MLHSLRLSPVRRYWATSVLSGDFMELLRPQCLAIIGPPVDNILLNSITRHINNRMPHREIDQHIRRTFTGRVSPFFEYR